MSTAQPACTPGLGTQAREWHLCCSTPWPLEAAWYGLSPSWAPSAGGSHSRAGPGQLCLPGPRATPPAPPGQSQGGQGRGSPITPSAGTTLPIWAQGPHVTSWQTEAWPGKDREAWCQLLGGTRSSQGPGPWLLSDFFFNLLLNEGSLLYNRVLVSALHHNLVRCDKWFVIPVSWS